MSRYSLFGGLLAALLALAVAPRVQAAASTASAEDRAAADALYEESAKLMQESRWAEAIVKLEASQRLDPGVGTSLRLADCYVRVGKTASAWSAFHDAEAAARRARDKRADYAAKEAKLLEPQLSRLVVEIAPETQGAGLEIRRDGKVVDAGAWGSVLPVDPGSHTLEASKPGKQAWRTTFEVEPKPGVTTVRVPLLSDAPAVAEPGSSADASAWGTQRITGVTVGGVGIVGLALGAAFGGVAINKNNLSKADCQPNDPRLCSPAGADVRRSAGWMADASTITLIGSGVAVAAGLTIFLTAPSNRNAKGAAWQFEAAPAVGQGTAGMRLRGAW